MNDATLSHLWQALQALKEWPPSAGHIDHAIRHLEAALDATHKSHNDLALVVLQPCLLGRAKDTATRSGSL